MGGTFKWAGTLSEMLKLEVCKLQQTLAGDEENTKKNLRRSG